MSIVYLNGDFVPLDEARVPVLDRGFMFGDGVYEVVPVYAGQPFHAERHMERLENSLAAIRIDNPLPREHWLELLTELVARNVGGECSLYLQVTRGVAKREHAFPAQATPTVFVMCNSRHPAHPEGVSAVLREDYRWGRCDIKAIALLANVLLRQEAVEAGADETILFRDGAITEAAASSVFVVREDFIVTPPKSVMSLPGVTRDLLLEILDDAGLPCIEGRIKVEDLRTADEIWLTGSSLEVAPVIQLEGQPVGHGKPGMVWKRAWKEFQKHKAQVLQTA